MEVPLVAERVVRHRFLSGLTVHVIPTPGWVKKMAAFGTRFGGMDARFRLAGQSGWTEVPAGVAHFLEHKLFEEEWGNVSDAFARLGASDNAYTNSFSTVYFFSTSLDFWEPFDLLLGFVQRPYFTPENVAKEQGIIEQEIRMGDDNPSTQAYYGFIEAVFRRHPAGQRVIGSVESIRRITPETLHRCYQTFYQPGLMDVIVAGDLDPAEVIDRVARLVPRANDGAAREAVERDMPSEPPEVAERRVVRRMPVARPILRMGFKDRRPPGPGFARHELALQMALEAALGPSSRLYRELYDGGLIDDRFFVSCSGHCDYGFSYLGGMTPDTGRLAERVTEGLLELRREGLADQDLQRIKRKELGALVGAFEGPEQLGHLWAHLVFQDVDPVTYPALLESVTVDEARAAFEAHVDAEQRVVVEILPSGGSNDPNADPAGDEEADDDA